MERGDIFLVSLDPAVGSESNKQSPAVIVSNNAANNSAERRGRGVVTVVPLTTNLASVYPFQVLLRPAESGLPAASKAQAEQVRSVSTERFVRVIGRVSPARMRDLDDALRLHLTL
ncbi:MAG: mazF9 [Microbacteriaceae bacterium]|nr:mazF9 [Microbacteriaceae bacterium]